jgi:hypothetical protein
MVLRPSWREHQRVEGLLFGAMLPLPWSRGSYMRQQIHLPSPVTIGGSGVETVPRLSQAVLLPGLYGELFRGLYPVRSM